MTPLPEPLLCEVGGDHDMALEALGGTAESESLVADVGAGHHLHGALRHLERLLMPLQDALPRREAGQQRILLAVFGDLDRRVADLELVAAPHRPAEGARQPARKSVV